MLKKRLLEVSFCLPPLILYFSNSYFPGSQIEYELQNNLLLLGIILLKLLWLKLEGLFFLLIYIFFTFCHI